MCIPRTHTQPDAVGCVCNPELPQVESGEFIQLMGHHPGTCSGDKRASPSPMKTSKIGINERVIFIADRREQPQNFVAVGHMCIIEAHIQAIH